MKGVPWSLSSLSLTVTRRRMALICNESKMVNVAMGCRPHRQDVVQICGTLLIPDWAKFGHIVELRAGSALNS